MFWREKFPILNNSVFRSGREHEGFAGLEETRTLPDGNTPVGESAHSSTLEMSLPK